VTAQLQVAHSDLLIIDPDTIPLTPTPNKQVDVEVKATDAGYTTITLNVTPSVAE